MSERLITMKLLTNEAVASTDAVETPPVACDTFTDLQSLSIKAISASSDADVKVEYATSHDGDNWDAYGNYSALCDSTNTEFSTAPEGWNVIALPNPLNRYVKFKVTGVGSNPADTFVSLLMHAKESIY